jgi:hypothetical protein
VLLSILAAYVLLVFVGVIRWTMMTPASQGRLMFPAITAISLLMWLGWETLWSSMLSGMQRSEVQSKAAVMRQSTRLKWLMPIFMLASASVVPFRDIAPTYAGPQMVDEAQLPSDLKRLRWTTAINCRRLVIASPATRATDSVEFTYFSASSPIARPITVCL